jgi:transcription factor MYB, plant
LLKLLRVNTGPDNPTSEYLCTVAEDSMIQSVESACPVQANFQSNECAEIPAPENAIKVAEDSRLQGIEFTSPTHMVLHEKAGAFLKLGEVGSDSRLPSMEFTSPVRAVPTFQPYEADMPTPKFTASVSFIFEGKQFT